MSKKKARHGTSVHDQTDVPNLLPQTLTRLFIAYQDAF